VNKNKMKREGDPISNKKWKKLLNKRRKTSNEDEIHTQRCHDPIYQMLFFPNKPLPVYYPNSDEVEYETTFIDRLLHGCIDMLNRRYGECIKQDKLIQRMFKMLKGDFADSTIKVFMLLFIIKWEPKASSLISDLYDVENKDTLFGSRSMIHFKDFLKLLDKWVEMTLSSPYSQFTVVGMVDNFLSAACVEYSIGPLQ